MIFLGYLFLDTNFSVFHCINFLSGIHHYFFISIFKISRIPFWTNRILVYSLDLKKVNLLITVYSICTTWLVLLVVMCVKLSENRKQHLPNMLLQYLNYTYKVFGFMKRPSQEFFLYSLRFWKFLQEFIPVSFAVIILYWGPQLILLLLHDDKMITKFEF